MEDASQRPRRAPGPWAAGLVLVLAIGLGIAALLRREAAAHPEATMPDGTLLVVEGLTFGPRHELRFEPEFWTALKSALPAPWHRFTGPPLRPRLMEDNDGGGREGGLWLSRWDPVAGKFLSLDLDHLGVETVTRGGLVFHAGGSSTFGPAERAGLFVSGLVLDGRADTLRMRLSRGDWKADIQMPNPRHGERFETWEAERLPRTNLVKGFEMVLHGLRDHGSDSEPMWMPQFEILRDGRDAGGWFSTHWFFLDPTGNRGYRGLPESEPTWKVRLSARPTSRFPFSQDQRFSLGRIRLPGPAEFQVVSPGPDWTNAGLHAVVITGPGSFGFTDGRNTMARPPGESLAPGRTSMSSQEWSIQWGSAESAAHLLLGSPRSGARLMPDRQGKDIVLVARRPDGSLATSSVWSHSSMSDGQVHRRLVSFSFAAGEKSQTYDLELAVSEEITAEWLVASPQRR
jgi:hypothetical protein